MPETCLRNSISGPYEGLARKKYNPNQQRVPAGSGAESGRWTSGADSGLSSMEAKPLSSIPAAHSPDSAQAPAPAPVPSQSLEAKSQAEALVGPVPALFDAGLEAGKLAALAEFATGAVAVAGALAVLGVIFVPSQHSDSSSGTLPGDPGTCFEFNRQDGSLRLIDTTGDKPVVIAAGGVDVTAFFTIRPQAFLSRGILAMS